MENCKKFDVLIAEYTRWIEREKNEEGLNPLNWVRRKMQDLTSEAHCRILASALESASHHFFRHGVLEILKGNDGWRMLIVGTDFCFADIQIKCISYDRFSDKRTAYRWIPNVIGVSSLALVCQALGDYDKFVLLADRLEQARSDESVAGWNHRESPLPRLVLALSRLEKGASLDDLLDLNPGIYGSIFENWNSVPALKKALMAAADYHCSKIDTEDRGESLFPPSDVFPAEIIAIKKIRERVGLETPEIDHPLMQTPLASPPDHIEESRSELLEEAISKIRNVAPYLVENL